MDEALPINWEKRPEVDWPLLWFYEKYRDIDRTPGGAISFRGMCDVLDEYGVSDSEERDQARRYWREMDRVILEEREAERARIEERAKEARKKRDLRRMSRGATGR